MCRTLCMTARKPGPKWSLVHSRPSWAGLALSPSNHPIITMAAAAGGGQPGLLLEPCHDSLAALGVPDHVLASSAQHIGTGPVQQQESKTSPVCKPAAAQPGRQRARATPDAQQQQSQAKKQKTAPRRQPSGTFGGLADTVQVSLQGCFGSTPHHVRSPYPRLAECVGSSVEPPSSYRACRS